MTPTLAHKVESEIRDRGDIRDGTIIVTAQGGTVTLRGRIDRLEQRNQIERLVRAVPGVGEVRNLLSLRPLAAAGASLHGSRS